MDFFDFFRKRKTTSKRDIKNSSIFSSYRFVSTLDTRTCLVCGFLDGKIFNTEEEAMSHKCLNDSCRCAVIPEIKGMEGFHDNDTRASMDGQVPANMTFSKWLKKQPIVRKKEILGNYYSQYKEGVSLEEIAKDAEKRE